MPNPRAQRPLSLQAVTEDIRSLAQPAQAMLDMLAGAAKGSVTATAGIGGDLESLARGLAAAYRAPSGQRMDAFAGGMEQPTVLPTTQNISAKLPAVVPTTAPLSRQHTAEYGQGMGEFIPTPGSGKVVKGGLSMAGQALNDRLLAGQSLTPFLNTPAPITHVIKPKGGNWMTGSVEKELNTLKRNKTAAKALEEMERVYPPDVMEGMSPETRAQVERAIPHLQRESALNNWVDRNLTNFVKKEMATPEDPVRKLAEQGITHYPVAEDPGYWARHGATAREERGGEAMAQSPLAKQWENRADAMIDRESAQQHQDMMHLAPGVYSDQDAWIKKLDPSTQLYSAQSRHFSPLDLGFDHILDVLREDLAAGRIRPEQLNKVSMEQAVRRTYEYDQEMAKKMREAAIKQTEGMPVHKEYPEGYKWIELARPKDLTELPEGYTTQPYKSQYSEGVKILNPKGEQVAAGDTLDEALKNMSETRLEEALNYEGKTMGHCVGGYCPDVMEGRSRIFSLRDAKGEPHVTIEVQPKNTYISDKKILDLMEQNYNVEGMSDEEYKALHGRLKKEALANQPLSIKQIKGKQNAAPKEQYLPYVQDFVRGGQWSDVGDLKNTGLQKFGSEYLTPQEAETKFKPMVADALSYLEMHPSLERHRAARQARNDFKGDLRSPEYRQLEREAGESIAPDVPYTYAELKALLSSPEDWTDRGDTIYTPISTALEQIERARQHLGPLPPTEGMKRGGKVHISNNPDTQMMELAGGGLTKGLKAAVKAAKEAPMIVVPSKISNIKEAVRQSTGDFGARRVERAADEIPNLEKLYKEEVLRRAFSGDNAKAVVTMNPADFEKYAEVLKGRTQNDIGPKMAELAKQGEIDKYTVPTDEYIQHLMRVQGGFNHIPYLNLFKDEVGIPSMPEVRGHEGRHRSRALAKQGEETSLVEINPGGDLYHALPRRSQEEYIEALREELERSGRLVLPQTDELPRRPAIELPEPYAAGGLAKLARATAKSKKEIEAIAERMAPQMTGEFVRGEKGTQSVAGKTQKQFAREKELQHDIRGEMPVPGTIDYEKLKDQVAIGIAGDPTITGKSVHSVAGEAMESPSPQHGGPLYGLGQDDASFWASQLGAAKRVQNLAREAGQQYDMPVLGQYIMMGPESINYAQHFADANLSAINPAKMTKRQIEGFNKLIRQGSQASGPRPGFPGIENKDEAYLQMAIDPELRKHFNALMQMPTVTEKFNLPSGIDVRHAVTEPALRDLETGVTGYSVGQMKPEVTELKLSSHPTYSHDIPGHFLGQSKYPIPYEIMFPDTLKAIRENPKQAPHEFGSLKMVGPRQQIDQQLIDEIKMYEEMVKSLTGKAGGGAVTSAALKAMERLKELKAEAALKADVWKAKQAADEAKYTQDIQPMTPEMIKAEIERMQNPVKKAAGGEITADDLILEERPL